MKGGFLRPALEFLKQKHGEAPIWGVEVGVASGIFSHEILSTLNMNMLYLIDVWENISSNAPYGGNFQQYYRELLSKYDKQHNVKLLKQTSAEAANGFGDDSLDFVYLDAGHEYEDIVTDLECWYPKVTDGGVLCGHDYDGTDPEYPGIKKAVDEFCSKHCLVLQCIKTPNKTYINSDWWITK